MKKIFNIAKYELMRFFISPVAYVFLFSFLLLNSSFAIYFGDFFNRGQADLLPMFNYQPWLYLLFVPAISMRLWSEEFRHKTIVQIVTMPVSISALVIGKFLAAWLFCGIALILTFPLWVTVNILGAPDNQVILVGYISSFVLAGSMIAISEAISALTKNQVIALVLAVLANLFFFWSGIEYILSFCRLFLPDSIIDVIASFSFVSHFTTLTYGLVELRDVIFFATLIIFFLYTAILIINNKTAGTSGWLQSAGKAYSFAAWICLLIAFFGINILANNLTRAVRFDATEEKIFTLSDSTLKVLQNLPEPVVAKLYFSPILEQRNADMRQQFDTIRILLKNYRDASNGMFDFKVYYPKFLSNEEDIAIADGIQPIPLIDLNQNALFGMTLEDTLQNKETIPFFAQTQRGLLEQDITSKIYYLYQQKKTLGIITDVPLFGQNSTDSNMLGQPWEFMNILQQKYKTEFLKSAEDFEKYKPDVVMLFYPQHLSDDIIAGVKKYSRAGGKFLVLLDPANEASRLSTITVDKLHASDLGILETFWKIRFYKDYVVADLKNSITVDATTDYSTNPVFSQDVIQFKIKKEDLNPSHPITRGLHEIMLASSSIVAPEEHAYKNGDIKFYPLMRASKLSEMMPSLVVIDGLNPQKILSYFEPDNNQKILAAEVIGMEKDNPFDLIVVGDSDFLYDNFWINKISLLEKDYIGSQFDNVNFLMNALDYLTNDTTLIALRGKKFRARDFEGIDTLRRLNSFNYKKQEQNIFNQIDQAKQALQEIWNKKDFEERDNFSTEELTAIAQIRQQLDDYRQQLSDIRYRAYKDIDRIATRIKFINIWLLPLIFGLLLLIGYGSKAIKQKKIYRPVKVDKRLLSIFCCSALILIMGMSSVYFANYNGIDSYENKRAFPKISEHINEISRITLKSHQTTLTFEKDDGLWILKEMPDLPVLQERIRRFLTILTQARFYLKKSDKAENLAFFDVSPVEDENSKAIEVTLANGDKPIEQFELGKTNIDIGRGAKAAYIRFPTQFQVWEIVADFVDMDLDWHKWTYSDLWNLKFGRIYAPDKNPQTEEALLYLMKMLLNTPIIKVVEQENISPFFTYKLYVEGGNYVDLQFYDTGNENLISYDFDKNNGNIYLKMLAKYLEGKSVVIDKNKMEKIINVLK